MEEKSTLSNGIHVIAEMNRKLHGSRRHNRELVDARRHAFLAQVFKMAIKTSGMLKINYSTPFSRWLFLGMGMKISKNEKQNKKTATPTPN